jgi:hypothetical protein
VYIFVLSHDLANVTNAAPVAGYLRDPPRRFVSSFSAAPTAPPGSALLAFPGAPQVSPRPQRSPTYPSDWLLLPPSNRPGADDDGESDVDDYAGGPPDEAPLHPGRAKIPEDDPTTILTTTPPFGANSSCGAFGGLGTTTSLIMKIPQSSTMQVARLLHP